MKTTQSILIAISFLWVAVPSPAKAELQGTLTELSNLLTNLPRTARITGEAELKAQADRAILSVDISTTAKELGQALKANQETRSKLASQLTGQGLPGDAIQASRFSSTEKKKIFSDKARSHTVHNLLKITVRNEKEFQMVAEAIDAIPDAQYQGLVCEHSDKEVLKAKAIAQACDNAQQRKKAFEDKLGLKLVPRGFSDASASMQAAWMQNRAYAVAPNTAGLYPASAQARLATTGDGIETDEGSGFGELIFRAQVTVEYSAEQK